MSDKKSQQKWPDSVVPRWVYQMSSTLRSSKSDEIHWNLHTLPFRLWLKMMISDQVNLAFTIWHLRSDNSLFEREGEISDWHLRSDISDWHLWLTSQIDISDLTHSHSYVIIITSIVWRQMEVEWKGSIKILTVMILQTRIKPSNEASHPLTNPISKSQSKIYRKERTNPDGFLFLTNNRIPLLNTHMSTSGPPCSWVHRAS